MKNWRIFFFRYVSHHMRRSGYEPFWSRHIHHCLWNLSNTISSCSNDAFNSQYPHPHCVWGTFNHNRTSAALWSVNAANMMATLCFSGHNDGDIYSLIYSGCPMCVMSVYWPGFWCTPCVDEHKASDEGVQCLAISRGPRTIGLVRDTVKISCYDTVGREVPQ